MTKLFSKGSVTLTQQQLDTAFGQVEPEWSAPFLLKSVYERGGSLFLDLFDDQGMLQRSPARFIKFSGHQAVKNKASQLIGKWVRTRTANPNKNTPLLYWIDIAEYSGDDAKAHKNSYPLKIASDEQQRCVENFLATDALKISAFAGTGKTTTLQHLAGSLPGARGLYLAFGRAVADEARQRFPRNVHCSTTHAMAYASINRKFPKLKLGGEFGASQVIDCLDLKDMEIGPNSSYSARQIAFWILKSLRNFQQSSVDEPELTHVEIASRSFGDQEAAIKDYILQCVIYLWQSALSQNSVVPLGFDGYLKLWCSSAERLPFDYIMLDEAQDTNEAVIHMLNQQQIKKVLVGDKYQQIYGFRGAFNAMEKLQSYEEVSLTKTFRFGQSIADVANTIIQKFGETKKIVGDPDRQSQVTKMRGETLICRSNIGLLEALLGNISKRVAIVGGVGRHQTVVEDIQRLQAGVKAMYTPELFGFSQWREVERFAELPEGEELRKYANLGRNSNIARLKSVLERTEHSENSAELKLATAHQTKGAEWDSVQLADDFCSTQRLNAFSKIHVSIDDREAEELNLLYVAITRAKFSLNIPERVLDALKVETKKVSLEHDVPHINSAPVPLKPLQPNFRPDTAPVSSSEVNEQPLVETTSRLSAQKLTALKDKFNVRK